MTLVLHHVELRRLANEIDQAAPRDIAVRTERIREIADEIAPQTQQRYWRFKVTSQYPFPTDMLRYDRCWPADAETAERIARSHEVQGKRESMSYTLEAVSRLGPTTGRWQSFMFSIDEVYEEPC